MGQARRKQQIREGTSHLDNATTLINRMREEAVEVEPFKRENWWAAPDTVWIRRDPDKTVGIGAIVGGKKVRQDFGTVEVSGIDWLKPGDRVLFTKYGGTDMEADDAKLVSVHRLQIYGGKKLPA
jgi:co-chaperonin GroES (HSP10)